MVFTILKAISLCDVDLCILFVQVINGVKKLLQVFEDKGYVIKASVEPVQFSADKLGGKLRVSSSLSTAYWT